MTEQELNYWNMTFPTSPLQLGTKVKVNPNNEYYEDWKGEFVISGISLNAFHKINITIAPNLQAVGCHHSDGWSVYDLRAVN